MFQYANQQSESRSALVTAKFSQKPTWVQGVPAAVTSQEH